MKKILLALSVFTLSGCVLSDISYNSLLGQPENWNTESAETIAAVENSNLKLWWTRFNDPVLDKLIDRALKDSPDRLIAEARIAEARGLRRTAKSALFPQIGVSGQVGREDTGSDADDYPDNFYEAGFDASYEVDIFGRNRKNLSAASEQILEAQEQYHGVSLSLIAEVTRNYIDYRAAENQLRIAHKNLDSQEKTLELIDELHRLGSSPKLDVERTNNLVNTTRASIPEFQRQANNARLRLSVLVGVLPEALPEDLDQSADIPGADVQPVLMAPAQVLAARPDVRAAGHFLSANTALADAATADIFPTFTISGFYGIADNALAGSISPWSVALGAAVSLLDFGRIEGRIDAAKAREQQAYQMYRKTILEAVSEVETALNDYAHINEQRISLKLAYDSADSALYLSQTLFKEGEIAFLDVLDAQRTANDAEAALVRAKAAQAESLTRLYKSLGVY